jgi:hypothetical protein
MTTISNAPSTFCRVKCSDSDDVVQLTAAAAGNVQFFKDAFCLGEESFEDKLLEVPERFKTKTIRKVCEFLEHHVKEPWSDLASPFLLDSFKKVSFVVLASIFL